MGICSFCLLHSQVKGTALQVQPQGQKGGLQKAHHLDTLSFYFREIVQAQEYLEKMILESGNAQMVEVFKKQQTATGLTLQNAAMIVSLFPIAITYPFLQKYFVKGVMVGSIKG